MTGKQRTLRMQVALMVALCVMACQRSDHNQDLVRDQLFFGDGLVSTCEHSPPHWGAGFDKALLELRRPVGKPESAAPASSSPASEDSKASAGAVKPSDQKKTDLYEIRWSSQAEVQIQDQVTTIRGGFELWVDDERLLSAEHGVFDQKRNLLSAFGHVQVFDPDFTVEGEALVWDGQGERFLVLEPRARLMNRQQGLLPDAQENDSLHLQGQHLLWQRSAVQGRRGIDFTINRPNLQWEGLTLPLWPGDVSRPSGEFFSLRSFSGGRRSSLGSYLRSRWDVAEWTNHDQHWLLIFDQDYFDRRGAGTGFELRGRGNIAGRSFKSDLQLYAIHDEGHDRPHSVLPTRNRYFGRARFTQQWDPHWTIDLEAASVSDADFRKEFFPREFEENKAFENRALVVRQDDHHRLSFLVSSAAGLKRDVVEYLPRLRWDMIRAPIAPNWDLDMRWELANLRRIDEREAPGEDQTSTSSGRHHIDLALHRPFSWQNLRFDPFVGGRSTWYEKELQRQTRRHLRQGVAGVGVSTRLEKSLQVSPWPLVWIPELMWSRAGKPGHALGRIPQFDEIDQMRPQDELEARLVILGRDPMSADHALRWDFKQPVFLNRRLQNERHKLGPFESRLRLQPRDHLNMFADLEYEWQDDLVLDLTAGFTLFGRSHESRASQVSGRQRFSSQFDEWAGLEEGDDALKPYSLRVQQSYTEGQRSLTDFTLTVYVADRWDISYSLGYNWWHSRGREDEKISVGRRGHDLHVRVEWEVDDLNNERGLNIKLIPKGLGRF